MPKLVLNHSAPSAPTAIDAGASEMRHRRMWPAGVMRPMAPSGGRAWRAGGWIVKQRVTAGPAADGGQPRAAIAQRNHIDGMCGRSISVHGLGARTVDAHGAAAPVQGHPHRAVGPGEHLAGVAETTGAR